MIPGRGAAFGDLFNDGKIDVVINPIDGPPVLLQQRESRSSSLGGDEAGGATIRRTAKEPARCDLRDGLSEGQWHAPARRTCCPAAVIFRRTIGGCTSGWAMRATRARQRFTGLREQRRQLSFRRSIGFTPSKRAKGSLTLYATANACVVAKVPGAKATPALQTLGPMARFRFVVCLACDGRRDAADLSGRTKETSSNEAGRVATKRHERWHLVGGIVCACL